MIYVAGVLSRVTGKRLSILSERMTTWKTCALNMETGMQACSA